MNIESNEPGTSAESSVAVQHPAPRLPVHPSPALHPHSHPHGRGRGWKIGAGLILVVAVVGAALWVRGREKASPTTEAASGASVAGDPTTTVEVVSPTLGGIRRTTNPAGYAPCLRVGQSVRQALRILEGLERGHRRPGEARRPAGRDRRSRGDQGRRARQCGPGAGQGPGQAGRGPSRHGKGRGPFLRRLPEEGRGRRGRIHRPSRLPRERAEPDHRTGPLAVRRAQAGRRGARTVRIGRGRRERRNGERRRRQGQGDRGPGPRPAVRGPTSSRPRRMSIWPRPISTWPG